jgi:hypothetical protein
MQISLHRKTAAGVLAAVWLAAGGTAFAAGGQQVARLCASGDPQCLEDAAKSLGQAINVCDKSNGKQNKVKTWPFMADLPGDQPVAPSLSRCAPPA